MRGTSWIRGIALAAVAAIGCGDAAGAVQAISPDGAAPRADASSEVQPTWIRGRITDVEGNPLADVPVVADGVRAQTDAQGRFELQTSAKQDVRVAVESDALSGAQLPVDTKEAPVNVEVSVKPRSSLMLADASKGGRVEAEDGFALELPADGLQYDDGEPVKGAVEVRYTVIKSPDEVTAAPGRMQAVTQQGLEGYGMAELRFYKDGQRVRPSKELQVEVPLHADHGLKDDDEVALYTLGSEDLRWQEADQGKVRGDKVVIRTTKDEWLSAAREIPAESCVSGRLGLGEASAEQVQNTTIRAARKRGLSLVQAETGADGSFCLPVTPDDDWSVSTFYDDGATAFALRVELDSFDAAGMCGGDTGCKNVGDVALPVVD